MALTRTPRQLLKGSLRLLTVGGEDEDLAPAQLNNAFEMMNEWLMAQGPEFQYAIVNESFSLTASTNAYTIGDGADFDTERPHRLLNAWLRRGNTDYPLDVSTREDWENQPYKAMGLNRMVIYYQPTFPNGAIYLDVVPSTGDSLFLSTEKPINEVSTLDTALSMPSEYMRAIRHNMAIELAPEYDKTVHPSIVKAAVESMSVIKTRNIGNDPVLLDQDSIFKPYPRHYAQGLGAYTSASQITVVSGSGEEFIVT